MLGKLIDRPEFGLLSRSGHARGRKTHLLHRVFQISRALGIDLAVKFHMAGRATGLAFEIAIVAAREWVVFSVTQA